VLQPQKEREREREIVAAWRTRASSHKMPFSYPAQTPAAPVRLPVHLPGHFATLDAPCGGGKRKMRSSFPGSLSRADFRAASHGHF